MGSRCVAATAVVGVLTLPACSAEEPPQQDVSTPAVSTNGLVRTSAYRCEDGQYLVLAQTDDRSATLFHSDGTLMLRGEDGSRSAYGNDTLVLVQGERSAVLEAPGRRLACEEDRRQSIIEHAKLRGADYWAVGNEPGWTLEVFPDSIHFATAYGAEHYRFPTPEPEVDAEGRRATYRARSANRSLTVTISYRQCQDDMSGEAFEGAVELVFGGTPYRGCGQPLH